MSFSVYPYFYRRAGCILSKAAATISVLEVVLLFVAMYLKEYTQAFVFTAFLFSVILSIVAWRAYNIGSCCNHRVEIQIKNELIILYNQKGKVLRSFFISDIVQVKTVDLSMVVYNSSVPVVRKEPFICITSTMVDPVCERSVCYETLSRNPHCIVFAFDQNALDLLQMVLPAVKFDASK